MNIKKKAIFKNFSYTLISNFISVLVSTLVVLIVPKLIGVEEYGHYQLYLFFSSYVGFLRFGWNDGIYLRYGGKKYNDLDKVLFSSQLYSLMIFQILLALLFILLSTFFISNEEYSFIIKMLAMCLFISNTRDMMISILQATNRIKEYAQIILTDRILYVFLVISFLLFGVRDYKSIIVAALISELISLVYTMFCCKDIVFIKFNNVYFNLKESLENISVGIKLTFANMASLLIIGTVRFGIEHSWDVATFGKVSLTLSISNLLMLFINAVGIVIFPILKRTESQKLPSIYLSTRDFLMVILLFSLIIYYPLKLILSLWLPQFSESLLFMILLFPMVLFEGKMALLISTYLKTLRKESLLLKINIITLLISIITTLITTMLLKNLNLAVLTIVLLLAFRSVVAEIILSKYLKIAVLKDILLELIMMFIFMSSMWFIDAWFSVPLYLFFYGTYLITKRRDLYSSINILKALIKK